MSQHTTIELIGTQRVDGRDFAGVVKNGSIASVFEPQQTSDKRDTVVRSDWRVAFRVFILLLGGLKLAKSHGLFTVFTDCRKILEVRDLLESSSNTALLGDGSNTPDTLDPDVRHAAIELRLVTSSLPVGLQDIQIVYQPELAGRAVFLNVVNDMIDGTVPGAEPGCSLATEFCTNTRTSAHVVMTVMGMGNYTHGYRAYGNIALGYWSSLVPEEERQVVKKLIHVTPSANLLRAIPSAEIRAKTYTPYILRLKQDEPYRPEVLDALLARSSAAFSELCPAPDTVKGLKRKLSPLTDNIQLELNKELDSERPAKKARPTNSRAGYPDETEDSEVERRKAAKKEANKAAKKAAKARKAEAKAMAAAAAA